MAVSQRISQRSVEAARQRAEREVRVLLDAAFAVLRRTDIERLTVAEVLTEAGLSTRAFYRHFPSKDDLVLALFASESERATAERAAALDDIADPLAALDAWIDGVLALAYEPRRARRTRVLHAEGYRLRREFPTEFRHVVREELAPLRAILERGLATKTFPDTDPEVDAGTIHAIVWSFAQARLDGSSLPVESARAHSRRFAHRALGVSARRR